MISVANLREIVEGGNSGPSSSLVGLQCQLVSAERAGPADTCRSGAVFSRCRAAGGGGAAAGRIPVWLFQIRTMVLAIRAMFDMVMDTA